MSWPPADAAPPGDPTGLTPPTGLPDFSQIDLDDDPLPNTSDPLLNRLEAVLHAEFPNRYQFVERVSAGGQGTVYKYLHTSLRTEVAIKAVDLPRLTEQIRAGMPHLSAAEQDSLITLCRRRLANEAFAGTFLSGLNIYPQVFDHYEGDPPFVIFRFYAGQTVDKFLASARGSSNLAPIAAVLRAGNAVAQALAILHGARVVHRDLKPQNVLLEPDRTRPGEFRAVLLDLGSAIFPQSQELIATETLFGAVPYTPAYAAPEKLSGQGGAVSFADDCYAFGAMLYWALTSRLPFEEEAVRAAQAQPSDTPMEHLIAQQRVAQMEPTPVEAIRNDIPAALADLVRKLLHFDPAERATMTQAVSVLGGLTAASPGIDLSTTLGGSSATVMPPRGMLTPPADKAKKKRRTLVMALVGLFALMGIAAAAFHEELAALLQPVVPDTEEIAHIPTDFPPPTEPVTIDPAPIDPAPIDVPPVDPEPEPIDPTLPPVGTPPPPVEPPRPDRLPDSRPPPHPEPRPSPEPTPTGQPPRNVRIIATPNPAVVGEPVALRAELEGTAQTWSWFFGANVSPSKGTKATASVTFPAPGTYTIALTAGNEHGNAPAAQLQLEVQAAQGKPRIATVTGPKNYRAGEDYTFFAPIQGTAEKWEWKFTSGADPATSTERKPRVRLTTAGRHTGSVRCGNAAGMTEWFPFTFEVKAALADCQILGVHVKGERSGVTATFEPSLSGDVARLEWNFGGGATPNTSTERLPKAVLGAVGTYTVTLHAYDSLGRKATLTGSYKVTPADS